MWTEGDLWRRFDVGIEWEKRSGWIPYLVGLGDLFEFVLGFLLVVGVLVRVPSHGKLAVGLLEIFFFGVLVDLEDFIVVHSHLLTFSSALRLLLLFFSLPLSGGGGVEWRMVRSTDLKEWKGRGRGRHGWRCGKAWKRDQARSRWKVREEAGDENDVGEYYTQPATSEPHRIRPIHQIY